jgi:hypothetical protein
MKHNFNVCAMAVSHSADQQFEQTCTVGTTAETVESTDESRAAAAAAGLPSRWPLNLSKQKATERAVIFHDVTGTRCQSTRLLLWHTVTTTVGKTAHTVFGSTEII